MGSTQSCPPALVATPGLHSQVRLYLGSAKERMEKCITRCLYTDEVECYETLTLLHAAISGPDRDRASIKGGAAAWLHLLVQRALGQPGLAEYLEKLGVGIVHDLDFRSSLGARSALQGLQAAAPCLEGRLKQLLSPMSTKWPCWRWGNNSEGFGWAFVARTRQLVPFATSTPERLIKA